ncbi:MAG: phosphotransferase [Simkaniaceae bacterium]|nr:phosphotransferase [Simkaniaceae bacterium]
METFPTSSLLEKCAQLWKLRDITFVRKMENIVFSAKRENESVFLRLTTPLRRTKAEIQAELDWIDHLATCGLNVPNPILNREGKKLATLHDGEQKYEAALFQAVEGSHPSEEDATSPKFLYALGRLIAIMHRENKEHKIQREEWNRERGMRHALKAAAKSASPLAKKFHTLISWIETLDKSPRYYGLVHADLGAMNLFVTSDETISVIDFDDSCHHWYAFDLAIVVYSMKNRFQLIGDAPEIKQWLTPLIKGYRTEREISDIEISWIPKFIDFASLRLYFWIEDHEALGTFHETQLEKIAAMKQWASKALTC